jgi:hypothetical protein
MAKESLIKEVVGRCNKITDRNQIMENADNDEEDKHKIYRKFNCNGQFQRLSSLVSNSQFNEQRKCKKHGENFRWARAIMEKTRRSVEDRFTTGAGCEVTITNAAGV